MRRLHVRADLVPCDSCPKNKIQDGLLMGSNPIQEVRSAMATGWAGDSAVQDQIDATVSDAVKRARSQLREGPGLTHCEACDALIPKARRKAVPGVRLCVACQDLHDRERGAVSGYNRRGSKDSQLR